MADHVQQRRADDPSPEGSEVLYQARARVHAPGGPDKLVSFPVDGAEATMGLSAGLADFYGAEAGTFMPHASTLDYVVGATAGCLLGTFRRALAARKVPFAADDLAADAIGEVVLEDGVPQLKRIVVRYRLKVMPEVNLDSVERAHAVHHRGCAVSRSLEAAIDIRTELELIRS